MAKQICDDEKFVEAWEEADNVQEVATATGLSVNTCQTRASSLRKALTAAGMTPLKTMAKGRAKTTRDLQALSDLIDTARQPAEPAEESAEQEAE